MPTAKTPAKRGAAKSDGFTAEERAAMKETLRERKKSGTREEGERDVLERIAEMPEADRKMAERLHKLIADTAPSLVPRTWYGMPAYAKDGKVLCFFQSAHKFKARYATFGFSDVAMLDEGTMWPSSFALKAMTDADEARIAGLVRKAIG